MSSDGLPLFEYLRDASGCCFISDMPFKAKAHDVRLIRIIRHTIPDDFQLSEWNDLAEYLCRLSPAQSCVEAKTRILEALK